MKMLHTDRTQRLHLLLGESPTKAQRERIKKALRYYEVSEVLDSLNSSVFIAEYGIQVLGSVLRRTLSSTRELELLLSIMTFVAHLPGAKRIEQTLESSIHSSKTTSPCLHLYRWYAHHSAPDLVKFECWVNSENDAKRLIEVDGLFMFIPRASLYLLKRIAKLAPTREETYTRIFAVIGSRLDTRHAMEEREEADRLYKTLCGRFPTFIQPLHNYITLLDPRKDAVVIDEVCQRILATHDNDFVAISARTKMLRVVRSSAESISFLDLTIKHAISRSDQRLIKSLVRLREIIVLPLANEQTDYPGNSWP